MKKFLNVEFDNGYVFSGPINWGWINKELEYWNSPEREHVVKVWLS